MLRGLTVLIACQFVGEVIASATALPVPGPVVGMVVLLAVLLLRGGPDDGLEVAAHGLLRNLALLFVPASVGVVTQGQALRGNWLAIAVAIPVSTVLGLGVTGWVMQRLLPRP